MKKLLLILSLTAFNIINGQTEYHGTAVIYDYYTGTAIGGVSIKTFTNNDTTYITTADEASENEIIHTNAIGMTTVHITDGFNATNLTPERGGKYIKHTGDDFFTKQTGNVYYIKMLVVTEEENVSINETQLSKFRISPNPVTDWLNIISEMTAEYTIMDLTGNILVKESKQDKTEEINISTFKSGIYIIHFKDEEGNYSAKLFVKH